MKKKSNEELRQRDEACSLIKEGRSKRTDV